MYLPNGTLLYGKYKILHSISHGGFGCTYLVEHVMLEKKMAIKEFFINDFCNRDTFSHRVTIGSLSKKDLVDKMKLKFLDEAKNICKLNHPGIVKVSDVFEENDTAYYVMEYIDGYSFADIVKRYGAMPEEAALYYFLQVCDALRYVHNHRMLHLDIKPQNIMVDSNDRAILIDFGVSKQYDEVAEENTSSLLGMSPGYSPLEQLSGSIVQFMPATDIYSLGATLYFLLSGKTPLSSNLLASGLSLAPLPSHISPDIFNAIRSSMLPNKYERPQSVDAFLDLLNIPPQKSINAYNFNKSVVSNYFNREKSSTTNDAFDSNTPIENPESSNADIYQIIEEVSEPAQNIFPDSAPVASPGLEPTLKYALEKDQLNDSLQPEYKESPDLIQADEPAPAPESTTVSEPIIEQELNTEQEPVIETEPTPEPEPEPEPESAPESAPEPEPEPEIEPEPVPTQDPVIDTEQGRDYEFETEHKSTPVSEFESDAQDSPGLESESELAQEPETEPQAQEVSEIDYRPELQKIDEPDSYLASEHVMGNTTEIEPKANSKDEPKSYSDSAVIANNDDESLDNGDKPKFSKSKILLFTSCAVALVLTFAFLLFPKITEYKKESKVETAQSAEFEESGIETVEKQTLQGTINGFEYVDLGLPSGLKWATCNVGASSPEETGEYYAWGEIKEKKAYTNDNSATYGKDNKWLLSHSYIDDSGNLTLNHDAAHQLWGSTWRIPTLDEMKELIANTTATKTKINGVDGRLLTSKRNGMTIFLPASGWKRDSEHKGKGSYGYYWCSTTHKSDPHLVSNMSFHSSQYNWYYSYRRGYGQCIRAVTE